MRKKDELAIDKILNCSLDEFMQKGFEGASMRIIAENAGYSTGILYSRFSDKDELFKVLVKDAADELYTYFVNAQTEFASFDPKQQYTEMHSYVSEKVEGFLKIIYSHFKEFKLIICKSKGSKYENYVDSLIDIEVQNTIRFINQLNDANIYVREVRVDLIHMLTTSMFSGIFEVVAHDLSFDEARKYILELYSFFNAGWDKILGFN